ncbi:MAG: hypothetical protein WC740_04605 [Verrucomicrobiia bacterium]
MAKGNDKNYISFWFWMFAMFIMALPCVGFIMIIIWAFVGNNETRKNYFRAVIAWGLISTAFYICLVVFGYWPAIVKHIQSLLNSVK